MDRQGDYLRFDPEERAFWASHAGLEALSDEQLDAAYHKAHKFILDNKERLIKEHGWKETAQAEDKKLLLSLSEPTRESPGSLENYCLPITFSSFLDPSKFLRWETQLNSGFAHLSPMEPVMEFSNIFYLLQAIAPGMFLLVTLKNLDDGGKEEWLRALPQATWVEQQAEMLVTVLGSIQAYQSLLDASRDDNKSFKVSDISDYLDPDYDSDELEQLERSFNSGDSDSSRSNRSAEDFAACGLESCGYCGHCHY